MHNNITLKTLLTDNIDYKNIIYTIISCSCGVTLFTPILQAKRSRGKWLTSGSLFPIGSSGLKYAIIK